MDISVGSSFACLPETFSANNRTESAKLLNISEGQSKTPGPSGPPTTVKFKIRSAKDRQQNLEPTMLFKPTGKRNSIDIKDEMGHPSTVPSPVFLSKDSELQIKSKVSDVTGQGPGFAESMNSNTRGRTERREVNLNRSKSLDWRGTKDYQQKLEPTNPINPIHSRRSMENRTSLNNHPSLVNEKDTKETFNPKEQANLSNSIYFKIQVHNTVDEEKLERNEILSSPISRSSPVKMGRVAGALELAGGYGYQSLPSRLRSKQSNSTEERKSPWSQYEPSLKPDLEEHQLRSWVSGVKVNEVTGNQTIMDRIERLYGSKGTEKNNYANSRDSLRAKRNSAPVDEWFSRSNSVEANSAQTRATNDSPLKSPPSSVNQWNWVSNETEKSGTFPRRSNKGEINSFMLHNPVVSPSKHSKNENLSNTEGFPKPTYAEESHSGRDPTCLQISNNKGSGTTTTGWSTGLGTHSVERERSRPSVATFPRAFRTKTSYYSVQSPSSNMEENSKKETERNRQKMQTTNDLTQNNCMEKSSSQGYKDVTKQPKPQLVRSVTVDSEKHKKDESVLELDSLKGKRKTKEGFLERAPSLDSVRNTIHKFEALAQQTQTPSRIFLPRRAFSVPEKPKPMSGVIKSNSDKSLSGWNTTSVSENLFGTSNAREEVLNTSDLSRNSQVSVDKGGITSKMQSRLGYRQESEGNQTSKLLFELPSGQRNEDKANNKDGNKADLVKHNDEPDFSRASLQNLNSIVSSAQNDFSAAVSQISSNMASERSNACNSDVKNFSDSMSLSDGKDNTFTDSPNRIPPKDSLKTYSKITEDKSGNPVLPASVPATSVKSTLSKTTNGMHSNTPLIPLSNATVCTPTEVIPPSSSDYDKIHNSTRKENVNSKVIRWFSKGKDGFKMTDDDCDDEDDEGTEREDDSDSGESSVTITSNMSQADHRSFSLSIADLCNLGGLDYPPADSARLRGEERWMSRRSASLSSDISVLSSVTLLGTEELDSLLDDVRSLADDALQNFEDVQVVVLHKEEGSGLGFTLAGGVDQNKPVTVHRLLPYGAAAQEGSIREGDHVLSINGSALHNSSHYEALRTLRKARAKAMAVVVIRRGDMAEAQHSIKESSPKPAEKAGTMMRVTLTKSSSDLGFSLEGGVGSSLGDKPLTVQKLFQGGPVGKVYPGDELLELQGRSLEGLRRLEAWNLIKKLPPGPVEVVLNRPQKLH